MSFSSILGSLQQQFQGTWSAVVGYFSSAAGDLALAVSGTYTEAQDAARTAVGQITTAVQALSNWVNNQVAALHDRINGVEAAIAALPELAPKWIMDSVVIKLERWVVELPGRIYHAQPPPAPAEPEPFAPADTWAELAAACRDGCTGDMAWVEPLADQLLADLAGIGRPAGAAAAAALPPPA